MLLGYSVAKVCTSPRNSTWFTRQFLLVRGWGLGTRLIINDQKIKFKKPTRLSAFIFMYGTLWDSSVNMHE